LSARLGIVPLVIAFGVAAGPAAAIDPFFPSFGNNGIDVLHYALDLDVAPASGHLDAEASLTIFAQQQLTSFTLDLAGLKVSKATIFGVPAKFSQAHDKLIITPRWPIPRFATFKLTVHYGGAPKPIQDPTVPDDPDYRLGWFKSGNVSYAVSEPVGASTFFPANDEPTDKASFTIAVTVPQTYLGVANGTLQSIRTIGMKKRFVWDMPQQMTTWLATVHVNDKFRIIQARTPEGTPVRVYATPTTPAAEVRNHLAARLMIPYFERLIGRYPFASYGAVVIDDPALYYALETQSLSTFPHGTADDIAIDEAFVAHELAHQWFGDSVSVEKWKDLWIAEGAATYFEILWPNRNDPAAFKKAMENNYDYVVKKHLGAPVVDTPEEMFGDPVYVRGAAALYALQLKVGDRTFFRILKTFLDFYHGRNAGTEDFINVAAFVSHDRTMRPFLHAWLLEDPVPALPGHSVSATAGAMAAQRSVVGLRCGPIRHRGERLGCE